VSAFSLSVAANEFFGRRRGGVVSFSRRIDFVFARESHFLMIDFVDSFYMNNFCVFLAVI